MSVTVHVLLLPAVKWVGVQVRVLTGTGPIDSINVLERPFKVAVTVTRE
jgi:hypothetical protein